MKKFFLVLKIAATYIGTIVGAGFATGKEIALFFADFGMVGVGGILLSGLLCIFFTRRVIVLSEQVGAQTPKDLFICLFGSRFGSVGSRIMSLGLLLITSVMVSGAGAVFSEQLGLAKNLGIFLVMVISLFVLYRKLDGLFSVNVVVVPLMMTFVLLIGFRTFPHIHVGISTGLGWIPASLGYVALNTVLALWVIVPMIRQIRDEKLLLLGTSLGAIGFTIMLLIGFFAVSSVPHFESFHIPMAEVVHRINPTLHVLFNFVIIGEIFTTVVGNLYGLAKELEEQKHFPYFLSVYLLIVTVYVISFISYDSLLTFVYPLLGGVSCIFLLGLVWKR